MTTECYPELHLRQAQYNDNDRSVICEILNSCIHWLNTEKCIAEQWGSEQITNITRADYYIDLGVNIVEMIPPGERERIPVAIFGTGKRKSYVPRDSSLPEGVEEDLDGELYLTNLMVHRKYKGHGIGERLIDMAINEAREKGKKWLRADCFRGTMKNGVLYNPLVMYYQRFGFKPVRPFDVSFEEMHIYYMGMLIELSV